MNITETSLPGVLVLQPKVFRDERGFFLETYRHPLFRAAGITSAFVQDNHSRSTRGVVRGLHYQEPKPQGKLVTCIRGTIYDVAVDIRKGSPLFGKSFGIELSDANNRALWVPPGFAHGFCTVSDVADVLYKCTELWEAALDRAILWNDPELGIDWPAMGDAPLLSPKDAAAPRLRDAAVLPVYSELPRRP